MKVVIIDYGCGNIHSVKNAFINSANDLSSNIDIIVTNDPKTLSKADRVILPGVGSFGYCKKSLFNIKGLVEALDDAINFRSLPFLGICVGMQLLSERSYEKGLTTGLGYISGEVKKILLKNKKLKVPHMGWNEIEKVENHLVFKRIKQSEHFYFVHSYHMICNNKNVLAVTNYDKKIIAAVHKDNILGVQFHPEKSQLAGQKFIKEFLKWNP